MYLEAVNMVKDIVLPAVSIVSLIIGLFLSFSSRKKQKKDQKQAEAQSYGEILGQVRYIKDDIAEVKKDTKMTYEKVSSLGNQVESSNTEMKKALDRIESLQEDLDNVENRVVKLENYAGIKAPKRKKEA